MPSCQELIRSPHHQGRILPGKTFQVKGLWDSHQVTVYLPPGYDRGRARYPVAFLLDGQNLFGDSGTFAGGWQLHRLLDLRTCRGQEAPIVIAIHTDGLGRTAELSPWSVEPDEPALGAGFADWVAGPLRSLVAQDLRILPGPENTLIGGSSLGGLLSIFAFFRHAGVFGRLMSLSPSLGIKNGQHGPIFPFVEGSRPPSGGRVYLSAGGLECPCGHVLRQAEAMSDLLVTKGFVPGRHLLWRPDPEGTHNEGTWSWHLPEAMDFLLA